MNDNIPILVGNKLVNARYIEDIECTDTLCTITIKGDIYGTIRCYKNDYPDEYKYLIHLVETTRESQSNKLRE